MKRDIEHSKQHPFIGYDLHKRSNDLFEELSEELKAGKAKHASRINVDDILDDVSDIFDGKVGQSKSEDELKKIATEAENRFKNKIPPGYEDASKAKDCTALHDKLRAYGDYIIWDEIIKHAKSTDVDIIFVTDDVKVDWWQKEKGNIIGPRVELVKEFSDKTGKLFHMYTVERFLEYVSTFVNTGVSKESVKEINEFKEHSESYDSYVEYRRNMHQLLSDLSALDNFCSDVVGPWDNSSVSRIRVINAIEDEDFGLVIEWSRKELENLDVLSTDNYDLISRLLIEIRGVAAYLKYGNSYDSASLEYVQSSQRLEELVNIYFSNKKL